MPYLYRRPITSFAEAVALAHPTRRFHYANTILRVADRDANGQPQMVELLLHGHPIMAFTPTGIRYSDCGWQTDTTKRRMNEFGPIHIHQHDYQWYWSVRTDDPATVRGTWPGELRTTYEGIRT